MATDKSGRPTFPVWVGSLNENVSERELRKLFSRFGDIFSVKLKTDNTTGKSLGFGWVNFYAKEAAELSAAKMAGVSVRGGPIKTSGPAELERKGLFSPEKVDYRPLTDCSFYIQGRHCKNGDACVYRHSAKALSTEAVCGAWQRKQCTNKRCPKRHPGRRSTSNSAGSPPPEVAGVAGVQIHVCGGQCGDILCSLSFSSAIILSQHILLGQLQCTRCNIVCASQAELHEHRKFCSKRNHKDSTSTATSSPPPSPSHLDAEPFSDGESVSSEDSYAVSSPHRQGLVRPQGGKESVGEGGGARWRKKRGRRGGQGRKKKAGASGSSSAANIAETVTPKKAGMRKVSSEANVPPPPPALHFSTSPQLGLDNAENVAFDIGSDSSESSEDEEDDLTYTSAEMAQLLSLNEQDMHPYSDSGSDSSEGEGEGEAGDLEKKRQRKKETSSESAATGGSGGKSADAVNPIPGSTSRQPRERTQVHSRQPEPVGLFWDIENCSVPANKSAFAVAAKMRRVFFEGKREAEFMVVCDITKERKEVTDTLNKAQVTLVHVNAVAKNAADDKLRQSLRRFAHTYPAPSTVVLVSSDVNFSSELNDLRHVHNMTIVLLHSRYTSDALKVFAHQLVSYEQFLEDVDSPKEAQRSPLPNILLVTNLPKHFPPKKISSRLGQLSDNCGGRVLGVDPASGTARILFRTSDWAMKAEKRMKGEDVFGSKINLCLDYNQPPQPPQPHRPHLPPHSPPHPPPRSPPHPLRPPPPQSRPPFPPLPLSHNFHRLSGGALGNTFPPATGPPPNHPPMQPSPPPPRSARPYEPRPLFPTPNFPPGHPRGPPPNMRFPPPPHAPNFPPHPLRPPHMPPGPTSYSKMAAVPPPHPEGKILIFKIPATVEGNVFEELDRLVLTISLEACVKTERNRVVMWHSFSELQVLLRLDFHGTAVARRDELVRGLWEKGDIKPNVAQKFLEQCVASLGSLCSKRALPWQLTSCGWTEDEESDRLTRSQVIALLRRYPLFWVNWTRFKKKYNKIYHSALSEMAVHTSCKGAVMILGQPDNNESQVIIRYEMSPLVRISPQKKICSAVLTNVIAMLSARPDHRLKLLDVVREFMNTVGPLPLSASGRPLQEVLSGSPQLQFVGSKPSSVYLTLVSSPSAAPKKRVVSPTPKKNAIDLLTLATEFRHLLKKQSPKCELPLSRLQQEYQTLYHRSFRVADYVAGEGSKMRTLVEACPGIQVRDVKLPNNKVEVVVFLESEPAGASLHQVRKEKPPPQPAPQPPPQSVPQQTDSVADRVRDLLYDLPNYQITLGRFMLEYEKKYGSKLSYYGHSKLTNLLESLPSTVILSDVKGPTRLVQLQPIHILTHELTLLLSAHRGRLGINQIVPEYKEMFGKHLVLTEYGFPKLIRALEAMPDTISLTGKGASRVAILKKPISSHNPAATRQFGDEIMALLMNTPTTMLTVVELTRRYNEVFRPSAPGRKLPPMTAAETVDILKRMPSSFSVTGTSPVQYVSLVQENDKEKKKKGKGEVSQKQPPEPPPSVPAPLLNHQSSMQQVLTSATQPPVKMAPLRPPLPPHPALNVVSSSSATGSGVSVTGAVGVSPDAASKGGGGNGEGGKREGGGGGVTLRFSDRESQRLASETQRLLQCHHEHAMTVSELVQSFKEAEDPALPQAEELSLCLHKHNIRKGPKSPKLFQISSISGSVGDSLIQLNGSDCHSKLSLDLLHLFVYQPTPQLTHLVDNVCSLYQQCHGHKLIPAVYGMQTVVGMIEAAGYVNQLVKLDETKQVCSLTDVGCRRVMASLLVELLYFQGGRCRSTADLPRLFQEHFGFPLPLTLLKVDSPTELLALIEVKDCIQVSDDTPVLKDVTRFAEQLRILLTENNGRLSLDCLPDRFTAAFGPPPDTGGRDWLENKLIRYAPHVVNLTGNKWVVWAPAGKPYPPRKSYSLLSSLSSPPLHMSTQHTEMMRSQVSSKQSKPLPVSSEARLEDLLLEMEEGIGRRESVREEPATLNCGDMKSSMGLPGEVPVTSSSLIPSVQPPMPFTHKPKTTDEKGYNSSIIEIVDTHAPEISMQPPGNTATHDPLSLPQIFNMSSEPLVPVPVLREGTAVHSSTHTAKPACGKEEEKAVQYDVSPYGFLERDPELLAQLTVREEDSDNTLSTADALQQLIEAGSEVHDFNTPDLPPPVFPVSPPASSDKTLHQETSDPVRDGTTDYLQSGLSPDKVLQELYRVKESSGGILNPASMEPFLSYFGELSRRELERLESQQAKPKKTPSPTPTKGMLRNKRMMAIRFPGQGPDPIDIDADLQKKLDLIQLPDIPNLSDTSDDSDSDMVPLRPVTHAELLQKLMNEDCLTFKESSDTGTSPPPPSGGGATGGGATLPQPYF